MFNVKVVVPLALVVVAAVVVVFVFGSPKADTPATRRSAADKAATTGTFQKVEEPKVPTFGAPPSGSKQ